MSWAQPSSSPLTSPVSRSAPNHLGWHSKLIPAIKNGTVTLRERDSTSQKIGKVDEVIAVVDELVKGTLTWEQIGSRLEEYSGVQDVE